jgi:hypothetical protein
MMRAGIPAMLLAVAAVAATAGCGSAASSGPGSGVASSTANATAASASTATGTGAAASGAAASGGAASGGAASGVATPQQVVTGFIRAELAGHWSKLCSYLPPGKRSGCTSGAASLSGKPTGTLTVDGAVISGKRALVKVTGHLCLPGSTDCQSNSDPETGMPGGSETFTQAYNKAVAGNGFSPLPCIKVKGRWYVNGSA